MTTPTPHFELARVYEDGTQEVQIYPISFLPEETKMDRRGFLGAGITGVSLLGLAGCSSSDTTLKTSSCNGAFAHAGGVIRLAISRDGNYLISNGGGGTKLWSLPEGGHMKTINHSGLTLIISPDGKWFITVGFHKFYLYNFPEGDLIKEFKHEAGQSFSISQDGQILAVLTRIPEMNIPAPPFFLEIV